MIVFKKISIKNFMSIGNTPLIFDYSTGLTYVYGENYDVSEENNSVTVSNGSGKTVVLVDAPLFVLYGRTQRKIKKSEIVNAQNGSDCIVSLTLEKDGVEYIIERGLKPDTVSITKDGVVEAEEAKKRQANKIIEEDILDGISYEVFKNLVVLNGTSSKHFFEYGKNEKRVFINEVFRLGFLDYLQTKLTDECKTKRNDLDKLEIQRDAKEREIERLKNLATAQENGEVYDFTMELNNKILEESSKIECVNKLLYGIQTTGFGNISYEQYQSNYDTAKSKILNINNDIVRIESEVNGLKLEYQRMRDSYNKINNENVCYHCTQPISDAIKSNIFAKMKEQIDVITKTATDKKDTKQQLEDRKVKMQDWIANAKIFLEEYKINNANLLNSVTMLQQYQDQLKQSVESPKTIEKINEEIEIATSEMTIILNSIETNNHEFNILKVSRDLVGGKNFYGYYIGVFRSYLNTSINKYLEKMLSPHRIKFNNDLEADVFDGNLQMSSYDTLSTGEKAKINISLLLSFFDVLQSFHRMETSILVLDEVLDSGVDSPSIAKLHDILLEKSRERENLGIYVVSHKDAENSFADKEGVNKVVFQRNLGFTTLKEEK